MLDPPLNISRNEQEIVMKDNSGNFIKDFQIAAFSYSERTAFCTGVIRIELKHQFRKYG